MKKDEINYKSIKIPLKKIIKQEYFNKLEENIIKANKTIYQIYNLFRRSIITEIFDFDKNITKIDIQNFMTNNIELEKRQNIFNCLNYTYSDLHKEFKLNISKNFINNLKHYLNEINDIKLKYKDDFNDEYIRKKFKKNDEKFDKFKNYRQELSDLKKDLLSGRIKNSRILPEIFDKNNIYYDLKSNWFKYYKYLINMNIDLKIHNKKLINIFPKKSECLINSVSFDTKDLSCIFTEEIKESIKLEKQNINKDNLSKDELKNLRKEITKNNREEKNIWSKLFYFDKINKIIGNNKKFNYLIKTDGVSCSLIYYYDKNPNQINKKENSIKYFTDCDIDLLKNSNKVVIDPGVNNILYCLDEKDKIYQYRKESRFKALQSQKINKRILNYLTEDNRNNENKKDINYIPPEFELNENYNSISKLRQRLYINKQRHEQKLINNLGNIYKDSVFIIGDRGESKNNLKYTKSTPRICLKRLLLKNFNLFYIDEFNTSKIYHLDNSIKLEKTDNHSLLSFTNFNGNKEMINRDFNAVKNMMNIVKSYCIDNEYNSLFITPEKYKNSVL